MKTLLTIAAFALLMGAAQATSPAADCCTGSGCCVAQAACCKVAH